MLFLSEGGVSQGWKVKCEQRKEWKEQQKGRKKNGKRGKGKMVTVERTTKSFDRCAWS